MVLLEFETQSVEKELKEFPDPMKANWEETKKAKPH
jgi:hypothetical protein